MSGFRISDSICGKLTHLAIRLLICLTPTTAICSAQAADPYSLVSADLKPVLQTGIKRYISDQINQNWNDLWEIQNQTADLKNELLLGNRSAPDLTKEQFVTAMKATIGVDYPRLRAFTLRSIKNDKDNFIVVGCGKATRESWRQAGTVIFGVRIVDGKPKFDLWSMTSDSCT
jgi:hypothetical protein